MADCLGWALLIVIGALYVVLISPVLVLWLVARVFGGGGAAEEPRRPPASGGSGYGSGPGPEWLRERGLSGPR